MIDLYGMGSPNVLKVAIMLEEIERPYKAHHVRVTHGANYEPAFLALNPIAKVPVIVDHDREDNVQAIFESGAILMYLAETYEPRLLPAEGPARWEVLKWLMVQVSFAGPMLGQVNHFQFLPTEENSYAFDRFRRQASQVYRIFDDRLRNVPWLGGVEYSIADIAMYPWAAYLARHGFDPADHPHLIAWRDRIDERPAVKRAVVRVRDMSAADPLAANPATPEQIDRFFGRSETAPPLDFNRYFQLGPMTSAKV